MPGTAEELVDQLNQLRLDYGPSHQENPHTSNPSLVETIIKEVMERINAPSPNDFHQPDQNVTVNANNINELDRIPDIVKCLREFSGRPGEFNSWRKSVDRIFKVYEGLRNTPKYFAILHTVRHKIIGDADTALESYSTPLDWTQVRKCLMMHYSDKRDIGTLEYQITTLTQRNDDIPTFYKKVYQHLSLILDKVSCLDLGEESIRTMTNAYRDKALDTFVRGLDGDLPRLLSIREPTTLPQALHLCLKLDNMAFRMNHAHTMNKTFNYAPPRPARQNANYNNNRPFYPELTYSTAPRNNFMPRTQTFNRRPNRYQPQTYRQQQSFTSPNNYNYPQYNQGFRTNQFGYNNQTNHPNMNRANLSPKPPIPMEVDNSIHSRQVNYQNRPNNNQNNYAQKRPLSSQHIHQPNKMQRNFYTDTGSVNPNEQQTYEDPDNIYGESTNPNNYGMARQPSQLPKSDNNLMTQNETENYGQECYNLDTIHFLD